MLLYLSTELDISRYLKLIILLEVQQLCNTKKYNAMKNKLHKFKAKWFGICIDSNEIKARCRGKILRPNGVIDRLFFAELHIRN